MPYADPEKGRARKRAYHAANRDRLNEGKKAKYVADRERLVKKQAEYNHANRDKVRSAQRKKRGQPEPTRPEPASCECCGKTTPGALGGFKLDHCHETGKFRGWLCHGCNVGIGHLGDNIEGLERALEYLRRNK